MNAQVTVLAKYEDK